MQNMIFQSNGRARGATPSWRVLFCSACVVAFAGTSAHAIPTPVQDMTFSVDVQGPTAGNGSPDSFYGTPIAGTDILTPFPPGPPGPNPPAFGPLPRPGVFIDNSPPLTPAPGTAIAPSPLLNETNGWGELDALSYGRDPIDVPFPEDLYYVFSVDEFAIGQPGTAVRTEGALGNQEAAADTFITKKPSPLPAPPPPLGGDFGTNAAFTDGNGVPPSGQPGVGLVEPNPPTVFSGGIPGQINPGDNLDAVDFDTTLADQFGPVYFSLDSEFADPLETPPGALPPNYATAAANGFVGGDVLVSNPLPGGAGPFGVYAPAAVLGLDLFGDDTDDLDALKLAENGDGVYQESIVPFDWLTGLTDMLLYSVRRGSGLIGQADSIFGRPIEEGDVLTTPCPAGAVLPDGTVCVGGGTPGIFTAAEALGLATVRSGIFASWGIINDAYGTDAWADDLDALDQKVPLPGTLTLLGLGIAGLAGLRRQKQTT